jgi:5-methylthioadenosine/S-adenosylhomocysteine deaminase
MEGTRTVLDPGSVLIEGTDIFAVGPPAELAAAPRTADSDIVDATDHAVLPGRA